MDRKTILQQFDRMEMQVETLVARIASIQAKNKRLMDRIKTLEKSVAKKNEEETLFRKEKDLIREKIDGLLVKLGDFHKA